MALGLTGCGKSPDLQAIRSVCLSVEQKHPKAGGNFRLPIEQRLRNVLEKMGLDVRELGQPSDAIFSVALTFDVFEARFSSPSPKTLYSGSKATGEARLEVKGFRTIREPLYGLEATSVVDDAYGITSDIVYQGSLEDVVMEAMVNVWGEPALRALLEDYPYALIDQSLWRMLDNKLLSEKEVVPMLLSSLSDKNDIVRTNAMRALSYASGITSMNGNGENKVLAVMRRKKGIVDMMIGQTKAGNPLEMRKGAAYVLGNLALEPDRVVPVLISQLNEENEDLRVSAMGGLEHLGLKAAKAIPALEAMLGDGSERIQRVAQMALDKIRQ
jgi:hypothetical protein